MDFYPSELSQSRIEKEAIEERENSIGYESDIL
jgi:hypothetical protein